ncbi:MAG: phenylalanine 4-monooxygenase [Sphingomonadaceae bacterium]|nr:phenylalanine 4-monooxygenase [Sphingomonadaceae bacterium]
MSVLPPPDAAADWTIPQRWDAYTPQHHARWRFLYDRQLRLLSGRAVPEFLEGVRLLDMGEGVPDFARLSERLAKRTGWHVVAVPGLVPEDVFFHHLAHRRFPAGTFLRGPHELDYLEAPDVFHDVFGHVPLLTHPVFADYLQAYGQGGLRSIRFGALDKLARLYWYTVEFGLIATPEGLRIYGAGILSSAGESRYALESPIPRRLAFDLERVMRTPYRIDSFQDLYFVIASFDDLLERTLRTDFAPLYARLEALPDLSVTDLLPTDCIIEAGRTGAASGHPTCSPALLPN